VHCLFDLCLPIPRTSSLIQCCLTLCHALVRHRCWFAARASIPPVSGTSALINCHSEGCSQCFKMNLLFIPIDRLIEVLDDGRWSMSIALVSFVFKLASFYRSHLQSTSTSNSAWYPHHLLNALPPFYPLHLIPAWLQRRL